VSDDDRAILTVTCGGLAVMLVIVFIISVWKNDD